MEEEREDLRRQLVSLARQTSRDLRENMEAQVRDKLTIPWLERARLETDVQPKVDLPRRQEDSCYRQFFRLGNLLLKLQDRKKNDGGAGGGGRKRKEGPNKADPRNPQSGPE